jgi:hypothetical protein
MVCTTAIADALALALLQPNCSLQWLGSSAVCTIDCSLSHHTNTNTMRSFFLALFLGLLGFVSALSAAGSNLLVVVDDEADKGKYSTFWSDLTCKQHSRINAIRHS